MVNVWKVTAIIFIVLFILENLFFGWMYYLAIQEEDNTRICLWDVCEEYPDAVYEDNVCYCYDYDLLGNVVIAKSEVMD